VSEASIDKAFAEVGEVDLESEGAEEARAAPIRKR
jgi:hypothetical protein